MSIRYKVILPYMLLTLLVAVTGAYVVTRLVAGSLEERLSNQLLESGRVASDLMVREEAKNVDAARLIAFTRGVGEAVNSGDGAQIESLVAPAAGGSTAENVMIFDAQGGEEFHSIKQANNSLTMVTKQGRAATLPIVSDLLTAHDVNSLPKRVLALDPVDGRYYYFTAIPIALNNEFAGVVAVGTSVNTIMPLLKKTALADVVIYGSNGQAIASTLGSNGTDALFVQTISIPEATYQQIITQDNEVNGANFSVNDRWYRVARGPLKVADDRLGVFAVILPQDFVVESGSVSRTNYVILYTIAMIAVIIIGYLVARLIINPLSSLVRTSLAIAGGDLARRTNLKSRDEIGVLANTFDDMTEKLQQRTVELEHTNQELERANQELERANQILEQMDRTKMRFIQVSAHELRTPMTLVQGYAQMAQLKSHGSADMEKYTAGILDGTGRMVEIIDSMLDVSRIDSNLLEVSPTQVAISEVIERVRESFEPAFEERQLDFQVQHLEKLPDIHADKELLCKVFIHVIGNAIKYTPNGGSITVSGRVIETEAASPEVEIAVKDTGIGVDPQYQELIFEKFYQTGEVLLHSSGKTKYKGGGPGLGLAISRGIIDAHGGTIRLESPGYNEQTYPGSTVFVRLSVNGRFHENA